MFTHTKNPRAVNLDFSPDDIIVITYTVETPMPERSLRHEIGKKHAFENPNEEAFLNVVRTAAVLQGDVGPILRTHGLSESSYNALRILRGHHPAGATCGAIRDQMIVRVPDVTRILDGLEESGYITRKRDTVDRRVVLVKITRAGLDVLARLDAPLLEAHRMQLAHMTPEDIAALNRLLAKVRERPSDPSPR